MSAKMRSVMFFVGLTVILLRASPTYADTRSLDSWLAEAKAAESVLTGEAVEQIPDSRFFAETREENNRRLVTAVGQIEGANEYPIYLIGKNLTPTGLVLKGLYGDEIEYSNLIVDTLAEDEYTYTVARFAVRRRYSESQCEHQWEITVRRPASCLTLGKEVHQCRKCGRSYDVALPALGHQHLTGDRICDRCGESVDSGIPESRTWRVGDVQARVIDGETYFFRCIDESYNGLALFLCDTIIPADSGSRYVYDEQEDGSYAYVFRPGPIVTFGRTNDYKLSSVRTWLCSQEENFLDADSVETGVETAYTGSTDQGLMGQLNTSGLTSHAIGSQSMTDKLFVLSLDEAIRYKDWLWKFEGSTAENPESQYGAYSKGYWLRTPMGTSSDDTGYVYIVDTVNGNIRPAAIRTESGSGNEEADSTVSIGVRPAFAVPQG